MSQFDASNLDCEYVQCAVCEKVITGGKWFARLKHGDWMVALCCPLCTEVFQGKETMVGAVRFEPTSKISPGFVKSAFRFVFASI
jgi:hypothetical protein